MLLHNTTYIRADFRFAPSQWETALDCNVVSHWPGASPESALSIIKEDFVFFYEFHWCMFPAPRRGLTGSEPYSTKTKKVLVTICALTVFLFSSLYKCLYITIKYAVQGIIEKSSSILSWKLRVYENRLCIVQIVFLVCYIQCFVPFIHLLISPVLRRLSYFKHLRIVRNISCF